MKLPKKTRRYCPYCKKHTEHAIKTASQRSRSSARPMSRGSQSRTKLRGERAGYGNLGRYSKPAVKSWKRKTKVTRRLGIIYTCQNCKKSKPIKKAIRAGRIEIGDKVAK
jgi:large subunit ribosomal protein L44e